MAQFGRPTSDISTGSWTTTPLWSDIDEVTADGATTEIQHLKGIGTSNFEVALTNTLADPAVSTGHIIRVVTMVKKKDWTYDFGLYQGATLIGGTTGVVEASLTYVTHSYTLSGAEADAITDYTDLRIRITMTAIQEIAYVTQVELEIPDASAEIELAGAGDSSSDGSGLLNGTWIISGAGDASSDGSGPLNGTISLAGAGDSSSGGFGDLSEATLLAGAGDAASEGSGDLGVIRGIAGSGHASSEGSGNLTESTLLSGAGNASSEGSGDLSNIRGLAGAGDAASNGSGDMTVEVILSGSGHASSDGSAQHVKWTPRQELDLEHDGTPLSQTGHWITVRGRTNDASEAAVLQVRLLEGVTERWSGTIAFSGSTSWSTNNFVIPDVDTQAIVDYGSLSVEFWAVTEAAEFQISEGPALCFYGPLDLANISLSGGGDASSEGTGDLHILKVISGSGHASSEGSGDLSESTELAGSGHASSEGSGDASVLKLISGSGDASSEGTGDLDVHVILAGAGDASSDGAGDVGLSRGLAGSGHASSEGSGALVRVFDLSGSGHASSGGSGDLSESTELSGSGHSSSDGSGDLGVLKVLAGGGDSSSDGSGDILIVGAAIELSGSGHSSSDGSGLLNKIVNVRPVIVITHDFTASTSLDAGNKISPVTSGSGRTRRHGKTRLVRVR